MLVTTMIAQQNISTATFEILEEKLFLLTICYVKFCNSKNTSGYITLYTLKTQDSISASYKCNIDYYKWHNKSSSQKQRVQVV